VLGHLDRSVCSDTSIEACARTPRSRSEPRGRRARPARTRPPPEGCAAPSGARRPQAGGRPERRCRSGRAGTTRASAPPAGLRPRPQPARFPAAGSPPKGVERSAGGVEVSLLAAVLAVVATAASGSFASWPSRGKWSGWPEAAAGATAARRTRGSGWAAKGSRASPRPGRLHRRTTAPAARVHSPGRLSEVADPAPVAEVHAALPKLIGSDGLDRRAPVRWLPRLRGARSPTIQAPVSAD
jgi:hypothetical protein